MNMWLLFVCMQMCDPAAHTYDNEIDDPDAELVVAIYAVDPNFIDIHPRLREARFWPHFKDCIEAIDGSHFPAAVPASEQAIIILDSTVRR
jgi:hypothetical protein